MQPKKQLPPRFDIAKARFTKRRTQPVATRDRHTQPNLQVYDDHSGEWIWWWLIAQNHPTAVLPHDCEIVAHSPTEPVFDSGSPSSSGD